MQLVHPQCQEIWTEPDRLFGGGERFRWMSCKKLIPGVIAKRLAEALPLLSVRPKDFPARSTADS